MANGQEQINWVDNSSRRAMEESLQQHIRRLQALRDIDHAILSIQGEQAAASAALKHIPYLVPHYRASSVVLINLEEHQTRLLAYDFDALQVEDPAGILFDLEGLAVDIVGLKDGLPFVLHDLGSLGDLNPLQQQMFALGISSFLCIPLRWGGELIGTLNLTSAKPNTFASEHVQIAQEVADSLAIAIQQARLYEAERQRRQEAEVMRDVMAALASAGNLNQTLEVLLVNLHTVIHYDRAGLFLADEDQRYVMADRSVTGEGTPRIYLEDDPLVAELSRTRQPLVVRDVQADPRFSSWPDMGSVRGWLAAPLLAGEDMIGFLTLGSLNVNAYSESDVNMMRGFASQLAEVLEKAWLYEQSHRRTEELEVLSSITFALEQAESGENTLFAIIDQLTKFFGASGGSFLYPDRSESSLVVKVGQDESLVGVAHPFGEDLLWKAYNSGQTVLIPDVQMQIQDHQGVIYNLLFGERGSGVIVPLGAGEATFGLLCFAFPERRRFSPDNVRLYNTVAAIAGASLRRAVMLEALERQVDIRTQHLSTLYNINAVASEPLELGEILEQVLDITLESMKSEVGAIHFLDEGGRELHLVVQRNIPVGVLPNFETLLLEGDFWDSLIHSTSPLVLPNMSADPNVPPEIAGVGVNGKRAYIGAPIRTKGQVLGLLSTFGETVLDYTIEDITLFMTIADQIGGSVERARLMKQAELAAVVEERQRLARELHDSVTQLLYSQVLFAGAGLKVLKKQKQELAVGHLARIDQAAQQALKEMRLLVYQLRPSDYLDEGLEGALERRLEAVEKRTGIDAHLVFEGHPELDESTEMTLYRIAEEALNNTLKHAEANSVLVRVHAGDGKLRLDIADDGCGFDLGDKAQGGGMGLSTMRERANALGGELLIFTGPDQGTRIILEVEVSR